RHAERFGELMLARRADRVVIAKRVRHVLRDGFRRDPARPAARGASAHAIGHEHDRRKPLPAQRQPVGFREAGTVNDHLRLHGAEEELILILLADAARMREAEQIELVVAWPNSLASGRATGKGRREFHEIVTGWLVKRHRSPQGAATLVGWTAWPHGARTP